MLPAEITCYTVYDFVLLLHVTDGLSLFALWSSEQFVMGEYCFDRILGGRLRHKNMNDVQDIYVHTVHYIESVLIFDGWWSYLTFHGQD